MQDNLDSRACSGFLIYYPWIKVTLCNFCQELHLYIYFSSLLQRPEIKSSAKIPNGTRRWENKISFSNNLEKVLMPFGELTDLAECEFRITSQNNVDNIYKFYPEYNGLIFFITNIT